RPAKRGAAVTVWCAVALTCWLPRRATCRRGRSLLLAGPFCDPPGALFFRQVFDTGHHGPANPVRIPNAGEPVAGDEGGGGLPDGGAGGLGAGYHLVDVRAVQPD